MSPNAQVPTVIISIDLELAWGNGGKSAYLPLHRKERIVINSFLDLCDTYRIPCTWATVGNLFFEDKREAFSQNIELFGRGKYVYEHILMCDSVETDLWFGKDIIERILSSKTTHEVGCHSFFHTLVHEVGLSEYEREIAQAVAIAKDAFGISLRSYVHPRNMIGHLTALAETGFTNFRGNEKTHFLHRVLRSESVVRTVESLFALPIPAVYPEQAESGLLCLPASYFLAEKMVRQYESPMHLRVRRIQRSIERMHSGGILHIWFHPHNIAHNSQYWFSGIRRMFTHIASLREAGKINVLTMGDVSQVWQTTQR